MYGNVNGRSSVSPSSMASVWGNDFGDPVDCLNAIASRKTKKDEPVQLSHLGHVLFGKSLRKGHGVVCTLCLVFECEAREFQSFHTFMRVSIECFHFF